MEDDPLVHTPRRGCDETHLRDLPRAEPRGARPGQRLLLQQWRAKPLLGLITGSKRGLGAHGTRTWRAHHPAPQPPS